VNRSKFLSGIPLAIGTASTPALASPQGANFAKLDDYLDYSQTPRDIVPQDFIEYLRQQSRFTTLDLAHIPKYAVILHDAYPEERLARIGVAPSEWVEFEMGSTDPNLLYVVRSRGLGIDFILNRGLPGAGGITTQAAELFALGVEYVTHIGTCGLFRDRIAGGVPIISSGCIVDAGGFMLSKSHPSRFARPDSRLQGALRAAFARSKTSTIEAVGYTIPIYYYQPSGLMEILATRNVSGHTIEYVEMEGGALYELAAMAKGRAASVVIGVDRYRVSSSGIGKHQYLNVDEASAKERSLRHVLEAYKGIESGQARL
jgi:uridine phosphorylase